MDRLGDSPRQKAGIHDWRGMHDLYLATDVLALADILEEFQYRVFVDQEGDSQVGCSPAAVR